jgi:hypothetical protein
LSRFSLSVEGQLAIEDLIFIDEEVPVLSAIAGDSGDTVVSKLESKVTHAKDESVLPGMHSLQGEEPGEAGLLCASVEEKGGGGSDKDTDGAGIVATSGLLEAGLP